MARVPFKPGFQCCCMAKLYLLGGENVRKRSALVINERAFQDAAEHPSVVVFPWARASFDGAYRKRKLLSEYFVGLGAINVDFVEYSDSKDTIRQKIASSNLIYLTGGLVNALLERLAKMGVNDMLRSYDGVIVGRSAGALALCRRCVITNRRNKQAKTVGGMGLADIALKVHYKPEKDTALHQLSKRGRIYAVPSRSAIVYENGIRQILGKAYLFDNGEKIKL